MAMTKYGALVESARKKQRKVLAKALENYSFDSLSGGRSLEAWARELDFVNQHITIPQGQVEEAASAYEEIAQHLVDKLKWPRNAIRILPQGSARTQTLIRPPDASKFDIDAVCSVDISRIAAYDPMGFFKDVGIALADWKPSAKKRCWRVEFSNCRFYLEFTPSVPLSTVPAATLDSVRFRATSLHQDTALAVVDTPTEQWKTSNPEGFANWVKEQAKKSILLNLVLEKAALSMDASIDPVPEQEVPLADTLRVAIRLFKRHRDMAVRRGNLDSETKPISVLIVTLLTQCYEGLADTGSRYTHPIELLLDLAELLPGMVEERAGEYWVANPTVEGENFAERWNQDQGARKAAFDTWCDLLIDDLRRILDEQDEDEIKRRVREVFGCTGGTASGPTSGGGLAPSAPTRLYSPPPTRGLA
ncbi:nucleotidyltransferase [Laribacter hongkongensis]|uniref:nucleotidyltransferase domain-containing protein n=1 Tax=Laribacter hongkongensis TaxID=168471 RepID=UPI001EFDA130|nr:nucleotidyltransferase [Laribacter hongkongensis]MCG9057111.1 nucleotidyltransferase [Laribacter hongkongensis]MCG9060081.1 nucleotidyltransferase [Laribacter hongkongensis]MCG9087198.1 nucleotidyltransferase [Laribacter hongkongensis]